MTYLVTEINPFNEELDMDKFDSKDEAENFCKHCENIDDTGMYEYVIKEVTI